jgi:hypothetical protein
MDHWKSLRVVAERGWPWVRRFQGDPRSATTRSGFERTICNRALFDFNASFMDIPV